MKARTTLFTVTLMAVLAVAAAPIWAQEPEQGNPSEKRETFALAGPHGTIEKDVRIKIDGDGAWLGVMLSDISEEKVKQLNLSGEYGVQVMKVVEDSPAAKAGLAKDDIILEFAGEKARSAMQLRRLVRETPPGREITIVVRRGSETKTLTAKLGEPQDHTMSFFGGPESPQTFHMQVPHPLPNLPSPDFNFVWVQRGARLGISADELTSQLAQYFGVKQGKGILVREVVVGSAAEKAGLKAGDVIVAVDGKDVATVRELRNALDGSADQKEKRKLSLTVVRDKHEQTVSVELEPSQRLGPREMAFVAADIDPEELTDLTADAQDQAREYAEQAEGLADQARDFQDQQEEWQQEIQQFQQENQDELQGQQQELQDEMRQLQEERRDLEKEIRRNVVKPKMETGVV